MGREEELFDKYMLIRQMTDMLRNKNISEAGLLGDTTRGRGRVFLLLKQQDGISTKELASMMGIRVSSLNEVLSKMEKEGYIERFPSPEDRRVMLIELTDKGRAVEMPNQDMPTILFGTLGMGAQNQLALFFEQMISSLRNELKDEAEATEEAAAAEVAAQTQATQPHATQPAQAQPAQPVVAAQEPVVEVVEETVSEPAVEAAAELVEELEAQVADEPAAEPEQEAVVEVVEEPVEEPAAEVAEELEAEVVQEPVEEQVTEVVEEAPVLEAAAEHEQEPAQPAQPVQPAQSAAPAQPVIPAVPVAPVRPAGAARPVVPTAPSQAAQPAQPVIPAQPVRPSQDQQDQGGFKKFFSRFTSE